jgi:hypothetical protein
MTFWYGTDPYLGLTDPDADPGGSKTYGTYGSGTQGLSALKLGTLIPHPDLSNPKN